ncbi:hypothetical protein FHR70_000734 [Microvirga lupini]|uniref:Nucleotide modification associated domain-containing protein n=1 Tax=Microvirga lupini TaxID=420324 RepID=A0A7W4VI82_9HYPH|nr:Nmad5 family putative nucleotide modification protein [Microvirga lupini]MBB3017694.1 hypothetical protein [Microvirga lupini]
MTTQSFALSKEMRERVVDQLTQQAVAKHGKRIGATLTKLNEQFWADHAAAVGKVLQIDPKRYPELIAAGVVAATTRESLSVPGQGNPLRIAFSRHRSDESARLDIFKTILKTPEYAQVASFVRKEGYYDNYELQFTSTNGSVPRLNGMGEVEAGSKIAKQASAVKEQLLDILRAAVEFHAKATNVISSCRTSRQLIDIFPEAGKLLPQPAKKTQALAPVELVESVRSMLNKGVPDQAKP